MPSATPRTARRTRSFTLVEVLVVIGIISVLIALLFPVFAKIRRKFLVLACPIAYVGEDGGLYLVSANGSSELRLTEPGLYVESRLGLISPVQWSPCGRRLGFNASDRVGRVPVRPLRLRPPRHAGQMPGVRQVVQKECRMSRLDRLILLLPLVSFIPTMGCVVDSAHTLAERQFKVGPNHPTNRDGGITLVRVETDGTVVFDLAGVRYASKPGGDFTNPRALASDPHHQTATVAVIGCWQMRTHRFGPFVHHTWD